MATRPKTPKTTVRSATISTAPLEPPPLEPEDPELPVEVEELPPLPPARVAGEEGTKVADGLDTQEVAALVATAFDAALLTVPFPEKLHACASLLLRS